MRAAAAIEPGGIDKLELTDRPDPTPGPGEVLIDIGGAGVGPWDVGFLEGGFPGLSYPFVPGQEVAGVVVDVGEGAPFAEGDQVFASLFPTGGGFAQRAVAAADRVAAMPDRVSFPEAASLVVAAGTAHEGLLDRGRLSTGETVLVTAAAGGVGSAAVQIAVAAGARALGVASSTNHDYLRSLGASEVFDYHDPDWLSQVRAAVPEGVDLMFDCVGGSSRDDALGAVRDHGRLVSIIVQGPQADLVRGISGETFAAHVDTSRLDALRELVDQGKLRPQVEAVLPLEQAPAALSRVATGHTRGKVVLEVDEGLAGQHARA